MRIGSLHINWLTAENKRQIAIEVVDSIATHPAPRAVIAKMARSEVKNYLAQLAEEAEMPFGNPAGFLRAIQFHVTHYGVSSTNLSADPDEPYDPAADAPFNVIDTITLHPDESGEAEACLHTDATFGDGVTKCFVCNPPVMSLKCKMYGTQPHTPCSGTSDEDVPRPCTCACHGHVLPVHDENIATCRDECCPGFGGPAYPFAGSGCRPHKHPEHIHTAGQQD